MVLFLHSVSSYDFLFPGRSWSTLPSVKDLAVAAVSAKSFASGPQDVLPEVNQ
jgi:hypothetical protein